MMVLTVVGFVSIGIGCGKRQPPAAVEGSEAERLLEAAKREEVDRQYTGTDEDGYREVQVDGGGVDCGGAASQTQFECKLTMTLTGDTLESKDPGSTESAIEDGEVWEVAFDDKGCWFGRRTEYIAPAIGGNELRGCGAATTPPGEVASGEEEARETVSGFAVGDLERALLDANAYAISVLYLEPEVRSTEVACEAVTETEAICRRTTKWSKPQQSSLGDFDEDLTTFPVEVEAGGCWFSHFDDFKAFNNGRYIGNTGWGPRVLMASLGANCGAEEYLPQFRITPTRVFGD